QCRFHRVEEVSRRVRPLVRIGRVHRTGRRWPCRWGGKDKATNPRNLQRAARMEREAMRRWLPRTRWLLAWSFWVWLGFGLARELPRRLGPALATLPKGGGITTVGFIGDTNRVVLLDSTTNAATTVSEYDAESGNQIFSVSGPVGNDFLWPDYFLHRR